ncbi:hypothetical protein SLEP1_g51545 [Rubroshorea leprosula]|uniref:Uncharacterized protein n=1 Tax=Rubroshorea leprosula TaxID=152421 RepID=A0AAV5M639_9ROSI|nr:hypothetical protein SLEP1_g51545 [Rubroshorea leprosula]
MSTSDNVGNGVRASGNVIDNNGANNSGIGSGSQNYGQGSGSNYGTSNTGNMNIGPGAGAINSGIAAGSINSGNIFPGPDNSPSDENKTAEKSVGHGPESASINTENSHVPCLDKRIEEPAKHDERMEKSLAKMKELVLKLEEELMSIKAYLKSLN